MKVFYIEEFWDTKGLVKSGKSEKNRQYNSLNKKDKMTNNDLQNKTHKTPGWTQGVKKVSSSCSTSDTRYILLLNDANIMCYGNRLDTGILK